MLVPLSSNRVMLHLVPLCLGHASFDSLMFFLGDLRFWLGHSLAVVLLVAWLVVALGTRYKSLI